MRNESLLDRGHGQGLNLKFGATRRELPEGFTRFANAGTGLQI
jgi:hypothetical protein